MLIQQTNNFADSAHYVLLTHIHDIVTYQDGFLCYSDIAFHLGVVSPVHCKEGTLNREQTVPCSKKKEFMTYIALQFD